MQTSSVAQPLRFQGQYFDPESGLHYNRMRYYDPALGVYLSPDPVAQLGDNAYVYAGADPINIVDPLGMFWEDAGHAAAVIGTGLVVGVGVGLAVAAALPAAVAIGTAAIGAGTIALIAGGIAGGAAAGGVDAALTHGGCVPCILKGMGIGAVAGGLAAIPFLFVPAAAGYAAFAGAGAVSGAVGYFADLGIRGGEFSWSGLGGAVGLGAVFGVAGKYIGGKLSGKPAPEGDVTSSKPVDPARAAPAETPIKSPLGGNVDAVANRSPTLRADVAELQANKWTIEQSPNPGSHCDHGHTAIRLDPTLSSSPEGGTATLAHEVGHAKQPPLAADPMAHSDRSTYVNDAVNSALEHEGYATLKNAQVREEILADGGPDIGFPGNTRASGGKLSGNGVAYDRIYQEVKSGAKTQQQGAREIGEIYRNGETASTDTSGKPRGYGEFLEEAFGNYYDNVKGPGAGVPVP